MSDCQARPNAAFLRQSVDMDLNCDRPRLIFIIDCRVVREPEVVVYYRPISGHVKLKTSSEPFEKINR